MDDSDGIAEVAIYLSSWPGRFQELFRCWQQYQEEGQAIVPSFMESGSEKNYYTLFRLGGHRVPRVYIGNEFCEHRMPGWGELAEILSEVKDAGFPLTVLTPPCNDANLDRLEELFDSLEVLATGTEVVANDWGVLSTLSSCHTGLKPVLGRLMSRFLRDPRVTPRYLRPDAPPEALKALQQCSLSIPTFQQILSKCGVERIELDYLYQGVGIDFRSNAIRPSVYIPFGYVTTGRICLFGSLNLPEGAKFGIRNACDQPCKGVEAALIDRQAKADGGIYTYLQRGNTIFYRQNGPMVSKAIAWASQQRARLVFQPELPF